MDQPTQELHLGKANALNTAEWPCLRRHGALPGTLGMSPKDSPPASVPAIVFAATRSPVAAGTAQDIVTKALVGSLNADSESDRKSTNGSVVLAAHWSRDRIHAKAIAKGRPGVLVP